MSLNLIEINKIYNEDCLAGMKNIPDKSIDLILQDPPYNTTACKWEWDIMEKIEDFWNEWKRIIKDNGAIVMTASQPFTSKLIVSNLKMFKYCWVWDKNRATNHLNSRKQPMRVTEDVAVFYGNQCAYNPILRIRDKKNIRDTKSLVRKNNNNTYNKERNGFLYNEGRKIDLDKGYPINIINIAQNGTYGDKRLHPTQKPVALFEYLIKTYTNENDTVFDGFMGSGTTAIACINTKRNYIGFELDKKYFDIAENRIEGKKMPFQNMINGEKSLEVKEENQREFKFE